MHAIILIQKQHQKPLFQKRTMHCSAAKWKNLSEQERERAVDVVNIHIIHSCIVIVHVVCGIISYQYYPRNHVWREFTELILHATAPCCLEANLEIRNKPVLFRTNQAALLLRTQV